MGKRVALYLRVSTGEQTTENQRRELEAWARNSGHQVVAIFEDAGISGAMGRDKRPQFDAMLKAAVRREFDVLAAWSVDRLGRSLRDLVLSLEELQGAGRDLFLYKQALDTSTPSGKAMFQMMGVFSEFEREMIRSRVKAGVDRAKVEGTKSGKAIGRPKLADAKRRKIAKALQVEKLSVRRAAEACGVSPNTVMAVRRELAA